MATYLHFFLLSSEILCDQSNLLHQLGQYQIVYSLFCALQRLFFRLFVLILLVMLEWQRVGRVRARRRVISTQVLEINELVASTRAYRYPNCLAPVRQM